MVQAQYCCQESRHVAPGSNDVVESRRRREPAQILFGQDSALLFSSFCAHLEQPAGEKLLYPQGIEFTLL